MSKQRPDAGDLCTREGAEALARKLDEYWHAQGHPQVQHWIEPAVLTSKKHGAAVRPTKQTGWVVRSNLVRGQPPKADDDSCGAMSPPLDMARRQRKEGPAEPDPSTSAAASSTSEKNNALQAERSGGVP